MEFPITVKSISFDYPACPIQPDRIWGAKAGAWVAVRPVNDEKTYLGVMLGDYHPPGLTFDPKTGDLKISKEGGNPAMWVPALNCIVMGWGSWWDEIKNPDDLHQITDTDIQNIWYVKALKELGDVKAGGEHALDP